MNVTVVGIGRLGICLALCLEKAGYAVLGVDLTEDYIDQINQKTFQSPEPLVTQYLQESRHFRATTSLKEGIDFSDILFIAVPTNTVPDLQAYDHSIVSNILTKIDSYQAEHKHIVICSTVFPGYITQTARPLIIHCSGSTISYNPEFIAQGNIIQGLRAPDMVLIGEASDEAGNSLEAIYQKVCSNSPHIARMSVPSAEITKLAVNCFITAKIAFANLIGEIADETPGADKKAITEAIGHDQRIGPRNLRPGYGYGGPCFPRDNRALGNYAQLIGISPLFFRMTDLTNDRHAGWIAQKLAKQNRSQYLFENVCYKSNCSVPIIENSQKLAVAKKLSEMGKEVVIADTEEIIQKVKQIYKNTFQYIIKN